MSDQDRLRPLDARDHFDLVTKAFQWMSQDQQRRVLCQFALSFRDGGATWDPADAFEHAVVDTIKKAKP